VAYASRSLTQTERNYCQLEREALAVVWGCEYFHLHIYGKSGVEVFTDHKPLLGLFGNPNAKLSARLERWALRLQPYQPVIKFRKGVGNPADYLSRHPRISLSISSQESAVEEYVNMIACHSVPKAMTLDQIRIATENDPILSLVKQLIKNNSWYKLNEQTNVNQQVLRSFQRISSELCVTENGLVLRGSRIVIPQILQQQIVDLAHEGHQGINKTKALLREKVWFVGIDSLVQRKIASCVACCANHDSKPREPLQMTPLPDRPWQKVSVDFYGPLPSGHYLFVVLDDYSRFPEVKILTSTSAQQTINALEEIFSSRGVPEILKSDNGPPFQSADFKVYANETGFRHRKVTPYWPEANGSVESFMKGLGKITRSSQLSRRNWRRDMYRFLGNYRATPHCSIGKPPATVLNDYPLRTKLPEYSVVKDPAKVKKVDQKAKDKMKFYAERRRNVRNSKLDIGERVLLKHMGSKGKLSSKFDPNPYQIIDRRGSMIIAQRGSEIKARNSIHCKKLHTMNEPLLYVDPQEFDDGVCENDVQVEPRNDVQFDPNDVQFNQNDVQFDPIRSNRNHRSPENQKTLSSEHPKRSIQMPNRFHDYQVNFPKKN
jgi:hypothetical protein